MKTPIREWAGRYLMVERIGTWEYARRTRSIDAAVILAIDESEAGNPHVILVEQFRVPLQAACLELPAGLVGDDAAGEEATLAAARELEEETGYAAAYWRNLGRYASSPGLTDECFTLFEARGLTKVGPGGGVEGEGITVHRVPLSDLPDFVAAKREQGCVIDVKLLMLLGFGRVG